MCQIALNRAGIEYDKYYASEINQYTIAVTQYHYPDTIQLGDVQQIDFSEIGEVYLIAGGSPCTDFSFAGTRRGSVTEDNVEVTDYETYMQLKADGFKFKGQSYLFWEFVRALKSVKHRYFFLENVCMEKKWEDVISKALGVYPVFLNSELVSAQSRPRLYWTNIPGYEEPKDRCIFLKDILEEQVKDERYYMLKDNKSLHLNTSIIEIKTNYIKVDKKGNIKKNQYKSGCLTAGANSGGNHSDMDLIFKNNKFRRYTEIECERLQTVPDNWTLVPWKNRMMSATRRYEMLGNGWTVDAIVEFFKNMSGDPFCKGVDYCEQLKLI